MRAIVLEKFGRAAPKRTLHVCLKFSGCHRPSAAKLGAGAVDTGYHQARSAV
jgi:hypothetical protein